MIQSTIDNRTTTHTKTRRMWVFAFIMTIVLSFDGELSAKRLYMQKEEGIDFAYPVEEEQTARLQMERALKNGDDLSALQSAVHLTLARNLINQDKAMEGIRLLDSLGHTLSHPYSNLALLLESRLYTDMYNEQPWIYNRRTIPASEVTSNPSEWDRDAYSRKVVSLISEATRGNYGADTPLSTLGNLLEKGDGREVSLLTVADFIDMQGCGLLDRFVGSSVAEIPFYPEEGKGSRDSEIDAAGLNKRLLAQLSDRYSGGELKEAGAIVDEFLCDRIPGPDQEREIEGYAKKWEPTPWDAPFLLKMGAYTDTQAEKKELYRRVTEYVARYPEAPGIAALESLRERLLLPEVTVESPGQVLPGDPIRGKYAITNLGEGYILCVRLSDAKAGKSVDKKDVMQGRVVDRMPIKGLNDSVRPFQQTGEYSFVSQPQGVYINVMSKGPELQGLIWSEEPTMKTGTYLVSNLAMLEMQVPGMKGGKRMIVVDGRNQRPIANARVYLTQLNNNISYDRPLVTDSLGEVKIPNGRFRVEIRHGSDMLIKEIYSWKNNSSDSRSYRINLFTDLSIYHPGDSVEFVGVCYTGFKKTLSPVDAELKVILRDANYESRDTLVVRSDRNGRFAGAFRLPADGLLGRWSIEARREKLVEEAGFQVSEYKAPGYIVDTKLAASDLKVGDMLRLCGEAVTYAGMPVGDATVKYEISYVPQYWRGPATGGNARYGGTVKTGANGQFLIELPTENLKDTPYAVGRYKVNISVTDEAGETQEGAPLWINIGNAYRIEADLPEFFNISKDEPLRVRVYNLAGIQVNKRLEYKIIKSNGDITEGELVSPEFKLPKGIKPGKYRIEFRLEEDGFTTDTRSEIIVWSDKMKDVPVATPLWQPETELVVPENQSTVEVKVGSGYSDSYILATQFGEAGLISRDWIKVKDNKIVEIPVKAPTGQERIKLICSGMHNLEQETRMVTLIPEEQLRKLEISTETFRDRITPGAPEQWKFRFSYAGKPVAGIPVMAVMTDISLNSIAPFRWYFNPSSEIPRHIPGSIEGSSVSNRSWTQWPRSLRHSIGYSSEFPAWNFYGYSLYGMTGRYGAVMEQSIKLRGGSSKEEDMVEVRMASAPMMAGGSDGMMRMAAKMSNGVITEESADAATEVEEEGSPVGMEPMRETEHPLAFFKPLLTTDGEGVSELSFVVPDYNGRWQLQVMGYIPEGMIGNVSVMEAISSRPLMIRLHAPRFVRTGDRTMVSATVFNNTSDTLRITGRIEAVAPDGTITELTSGSDELKVGPMESTVLNGEWTVPSDIGSVIIRCRAMSGGSMDGEQTMMAVLPSSTPVIESRTFYVTPGREEYTLNLKGLPRNAVSIFSYCDNPIWDCLLSLPALTDPESDNAISLAYAVYGNALANGLIGKYPNLRNTLLEASESADKDNLLRGKLDKDQDLKIVGLQNTPWVRNAHSETQRIMSLTRYLNTAEAQGIIAGIVDRLGKLQGSDGGWSWCPGMPGSDFITRKVLESLAPLRNHGFMPRGAEMMCEKAIGFIDRELVKNWKKIGAAKFDYVGTLNYFYVRNQFRVKESADIRSIKSSAVARLAKDWRKLNIGSKATAAIFVADEGNLSLSRLILESLREYASSDPEKGTWFANLKSSCSGTATLLTTTRVMEAFLKIAPEAKEVEGLRQYIILAKQTLDWGKDRELAQTVATLLDGRQEWHSLPKLLDISINGKSIKLGESARLSGSMRMDLDADAKEISIIRDGNTPAWGGVISQFVAPIQSVDAQGSNELKISKAIYTVTTDSKGTIAEAGDLKVGDKVRITLTLTVDRDMDYVTIADSRSACLEPVQQISGYTSSDGVWMYRETRNESTNLFIPFLPKGTHVISYDCYVDRSGEYSLGIATAQSLYAPHITAHSSGSLLRVSR